MYPLEIERVNGDILNDYPAGPRFLIPRENLLLYKIASFELTRRGFTKRIILAPNPCSHLRYARPSENPTVTVILPEKSGGLVISVAEQLIEFRNDCQKRNEEISPERWQSELSKAIGESVIPVNNPYIPY